MVRQRILAIALLASVALAADAAQIQHLDIRNPGVSAPSRFIVEFDGTPSALARGSVETLGHAQLFARFRSDLARAFEQRSGGRAPVIRYEYRTAFLGAAVDLDAAALQRVKALPYVRRVHPDREMRVSPGAPTPASETVDARTKVNATSLGTGGAGIRVAVIDSGIDYNHPALGGGFGPGFKVAGGWDFVNDDADPLDDQGHGTHVAGTIAANAPGLVGVAPDATLIAYKVLAANGSGPTSGVIAAIERAVDPDGDGNTSDAVDVINMSLGGPGDAEDPASRAADNAVRAGVIVVVAAGNEGKTASIGSPGTSELAITVAAIDDGGQVTTFSSRGPSPRLLGFKPDVAAPGFQIVSTRVGGGTVAMNGTSMATPHVAGVAALLRKLHPDWTPQDVKSALTAGATRIEATPFARGAGRVDARAASETTLFANVSGLSFGLMPASSGSTARTATVRLTNRGTSAQTVSIGEERAMAGVALSITPQTMQIAAGSSAEIEIRATTANPDLPYPADMLYGGDIVVSGAKTTRIPWGLLRSPRARVSYDRTGNSVLALGKTTNLTAWFPEGLSTTEMLLPPGTYDFVIEAFDPETTSHRFVVREDVVIDSDHQLDVRADEATVEVLVEGRDETGRALTERAAATPGSVHTGGMRMYWRSGDGEFMIGIFSKAEFLRRFRTSPLSSRWEVVNFEYFIDFDARQSYVIEHEIQKGLAEGKRLGAGGGDLLATDVQWERESRSPASLVVCGYDAFFLSFASWYGDCHNGSGSTERSFTHYATNEKWPYAHAGMTFRFDRVTSQPLRAVDGTVVSTMERTPSAATERRGSGGLLALSGGPAYPYMITGTRAGLWARYPLSGFLGSSGEMIDEVNGAEWKVLDVAGTVTASGRWMGGFAPGPPAPRPAHRLLMTRTDIPVFGRFTRGTMEVDFAETSADLDAPTLTSLRVIGANGRTGGRLQKGEAARLQFSVVDLTFDQVLKSKPSRPELTSAWWSEHGTDVWHPLPVSVIASESGEITELQHVPAGDVYSADLSPVTAVDDRLIDLDIHFTDAAGNAVRWTHEASIMVGDPADPPRLRPVRRN